MLPVFLSQMNSSDCLFYLRFPREDCEALLAEGIADSYVVQAAEEVNWAELDSWIKSSNDWVFGWVGYNVRLSLERFGEEQLESSTFPKLVLFRPVNLFKIRNRSVDRSHYQSRSRQIQH